jgi:hypothetical protein
MIEAVTKMGAALSIVAVAGVLAACAPAPVSQAGADERAGCDDARVAQVERAARRDHKDVYWLKCPQAPRRGAS